MPTIAAIDVGSNAVRFVATRLCDVGMKLDWTYQRHHLPLGVDVFGEGKVSTAQTDTLIEVLGEVRSRMETLHVQKYRAVGTAAIREAKNLNTIVRRVRKEAGIRLEVIDGRQEAQLAREALLQAVGWAPPEALLVDLGGGTVELHRVRGSRSLSLPLGTLRLLTAHPELVGPVRGRQLARAREAVRAQLDKRTNRQPDAHLAVGTGGNLDALCRIIPADDTTFPILDVRKLPGLVRQLASLTAQERAEAYGLRPDRAEMLLASGMIVLALVQRFRVRRFVVPGTGVREALLHRLFSVPSVADDAKMVLRRMGCKTQNAGQLSQVTQRVFDVLTPVHGLWRPALEPLLCAAWLRNVGTVVDPEAPKAHTAYLIEHAAGLPLTPRARTVAAQVAASTWGEPLSMLSERLDDSANKIAKKLSGIIHLARCVQAHGGTTLVSANLYHNPIQLDFQLSKRMPWRTLRPIEEALGCRLRVQ